MKHDSHFSLDDNTRVEPYPTTSASTTKKPLSDDAVDGIAAIVLIALVVSVVVYWLETM